MKGKKEALGDVERIVCDGTIEETKGCRHPGWRHPASAGEVAEAVALGYVVLEGDGDVVAEAVVGLAEDLLSDPAAGLDDMRIENIVDWRNREVAIVSYRFVPPSRWNTAVKEARAFSRTWRKTTSGYISSARWGRWLIEDEVNMDEVLRSLGYDQKG